MVITDMDHSKIVPSPIHESAAKFSIESLLNTQKTETSGTNVTPDTPPAVSHSGITVPASVGYPVPVHAMIPQRLDLPHGSASSAGLGFLPLFGRTPERPQPLLTTIPPWIAYGGLSLEQSVLFAQTGK